MKQGCRVTPGRGNPRESATEKSLPRRVRHGSGVMVKRWGKSPPRTGQPGRHGKPHPEQCRIGASRGLVPAQAGIPPQGRFSPGARVGSLSPPVTAGQRNGHPGGASPRTESGLQAVRAFHRCRAAPPGQHPLPRPRAARDLRGLAGVFGPRRGEGSAGLRRGGHGCRLRGTGAFAVDSAALPG